MHVILYNMSWMSFNILLALIAVLFGWLMKRTRLISLRILYALVWFFFLPNTLYLLTDLVHLYQNMQKVEGPGIVIVAFQYLLLLLLGIVTYFAAVYPAEKIAVEQMKWNRTIFILLINVLVSIGITLGRVERTNSWYFVTNLPRVLHDTIQLLTSLNLVLLTLILTLLNTVLYLTLRASPLLSSMQKYMKGRKMLLG